jgi:hypothetical protein
VGLANGRDGRLIDGELREGLKQRVYWIAHQVVGVFAVMASMSVGVEVLRDCFRCPCGPCETSAASRVQSS